MESVSIVLDLQLAHQEKFWTKKPPKKWPKMAKNINFFFF